MTFQESECMSCGWYAWTWTAHCPECGALCEHADIKADHS